MSRKPLIKPMNLKIHRAVSDSMHGKKARVHPTPMKEEEVQIKAAMKPTLTTLPLALVTNSIHASCLVVSVNFPNFGQHPRD